MNVNKLLPGLVMAGGLLAAPISQAAPGTTGDNPGGFYVGGAFGQFNLDINHLDDIDDAEQTVQHSDSNSWQAFVGYRFGPIVSLEAAYIDFGNSSDEFAATGSSGNYRVRVKGFSPSVLLTLPVGPVELYGKAGYLYYDVDTRINFDGPDPGVDSSHSDSKFIYGGGLQFVVLDHLALRAEYDRIQIKNADDTDAFWLGAAWRF